MRLFALGFIAGFAATLIFHQGVWFLLNQADIIPAGRSAWPMDPIPPFGVPQVISLSFWGGLWGVALNLALGHLRGPAYWIAWIAVGALALTLVAFFVVPHLKMQHIPALWPAFAIGCLLNGAWGYGTGLFLLVMGARRGE
ncbi:MAG: hypothetical protein ACR2OF_09040 [Hyphomicrobium sp.]